MWIARDKDGELYLFASKPYLSKKTFFMAEIGGSMRLDRRDFPEVTCEGSPIEVELRIKEEETK